MAKSEAPKQKTGKPEPSQAAGPRESFSRDILPIPDSKHVGVTTYDARDPNTKYPPIRTLRPPQGAPNVLSC